MYESINSKNIVISKLFFYIAYIMLLLKYTTPTLDIWEELSDVFTLIEIILLCICILIQTRYYKIKVALFMVATLLIAVYIYFQTRDLTILLLLLFIYASKNICIEDFIKTDVKFKIVFLCLNFLYLYSGLMENSITYRDNGSMRQTFGFASPNSFGAMILSICLEMIYLKRNKLNKYTYIKILLVTVLLLIFCDSRSAEISLVLLCVAIFFYKKKIYFKKVLPYLMLIFTGLTFFFVYLYGGENSFAIYLDGLFSTRLSIIYNFLQDYEINIWGNYIRTPEIWIGYITTLDNLYAYLIINLGIIAYLIVIGINFVLMKKTIQRGDNILVAILIVLTIYGFMERVILSIPLNVFILFARDISFEKKIEQLK